MFPCPWVFTPYFLFIFVDFINLASTELIVITLPILGVPCNYTITIHCFWKQSSWLKSLFLLMDMHILHKKHEAWMSGEHD
jgi:hypothetical protein